MAYEVVSLSTTDASNNSTAPNGWPENMARSDVNNSARALMGAVARWEKDINGSLNSAGGTTAYTLAVNRTTAVAAQGETFVFKINATNTAAVTINVTPSGGSARGAVAVQKAGAALAANDWTAGDFAAIRYDGTQYQSVTGKSVATLAALTDIAAQTVSQIPNADNAIDLGSSTPKGWRKLYMGDGTVGLPAVTFSGDTDNGIYRIGANNWALAVAGAKALELDPSGTILRPLQTAFLALAGASSNATGDGTAATVTWTTEIFDQNADFATPAYTAPVGTAIPTLFTASVFWSAVGAGHTAGIVTLVTSNRSYTLCNISPTAIKNSGANANPGTFAQIADMDSGDTATITTTVSNSTKTVGIDNSTYFAGYML